VRGAALVVVLAVLAGGCATAPAEDAAPRVTALADDKAGTLVFAVDGREVCVWRHDPKWAIPHVWPLRSPSGRSLLVQRTEPFPHHRGLWIADKVQLGDGPVTDFYHEHTNLRDPERLELGHHSFIRHERFSALRSDATSAVAIAELTWIVQEDTPVLDQTLRLELTPLEDDQYLLGLRWDLRASYGDVTFASDWVHYAWPYLRMDPAFSGESGGTIVDDQGRTGQEGTNEQVALWIDYSNTIDGVAEGVAVFPPRDGEQRKWLTREYGTWGPRRPDERSGTGFTLRQGEVLSGAATLYVHRGDAATARVAEVFSAAAPRG
jgi:hypothetical protein